MFSVRRVHDIFLRRSSVLTRTTNIITLPTSSTTRHHVFHSRQLTPYQVTRSSSYKRYFPSSGPSLSSRAVVPGLMVSCIGVFGWVYVTQNSARNGSRSAMKQLSQYRDNMVLSLRNIQEGRYWTTITSIFAHGSPLHLIVNMMALYSFGSILSTSLGTFKFATLFFGSGLMGAMANIGWSKNQHLDPRQGAVGASGAICGLLGTVATLMPRGRMSMMFIPVQIGFGTALFAVGSVMCLKEGWIPWMGHADHCKIDLLFCFLLY